MRTSPRSPENPRLGRLTIVLIAIGVAFGLGLTVLLAHAIQQGKQAPLYPRAGARPLLGMVIDRDRAVIALDAGRAAQQAGIRTDDVLQAIDGTPLGAASTVRRALVAALAGPGSRGDVQLTLTHDGRPYTVTAHTRLSAETTPSVTPTPDYDSTHYYL